MDGILTQNGQFSTKKWLQKIAGVGLPSRLGQSDAVHLLTRMFFGTKSRTVPISHRRRHDSPVAGDRKIGITNRESIRRASQHISLIGEFAFDVETDVGGKIKVEQVTLAYVQDEFLRLDSKALQALRDYDPRLEQELLDGKDYDYLLVHTEPGTNKITAY